MYTRNRVYIGRNRVELSPGTFYLQIGGSAGRIV